MNEPVTTEYALQPDIWKRARNGRSLASQARLLGISPGRLDHYEKGRRRPDPVTFLKMLDAYGLTPRDFAYKRC